MNYTTTQEQNQNCNFAIYSTYFSWFILKKNSKWKQKKSFCAMKLQIFCISHSSMILLLLYLWCYIFYIYLCSLLLFCMGVFIFFWLMLLNLYTCRLMMIDRSWYAVYTYNICIKRGCENVQKYVLWKNNNVL